MTPASAKSPRKTGTKSSPSAKYKLPSCADILYVLPEFQLISSAQNLASAQQTLLTLVGDGTLTQTRSGFDVQILQVDRSSGSLTKRSSFGGRGGEFARAAASDARGAIYVAGDTNSVDLPTLNPVQASFAGRLDGFVRSEERRVGKECRL